MKGEEYRRKGLAWFGEWIRQGTGFGRRDVGKVGKQIYLAVDVGDREKKPTTERRKNQSCFKL